MDEGWFPAGRSMVRTVHDERVVGLFYGQRALTIGALDPRNFVGTIQSSSGRLAPFRRLARTASAFETVFFGTRAEADRLLERVAKMHARVAGGLPGDAGPYAAGTPYAAFDPELMLWTVAVTFDSAQHFYELFVRHLTDGEREQLWQEYVRFGALFGMPPEIAPRSYGEFRAWYEARLASDEMWLTPEARYTGAAIAFQIPMGRANVLGKRIHDAIMRGSLPPRVRELYGLRWEPADARRARVCVALVRGGRQVAPRALTHGSCRANYDLVAAVERGRLRRGEPTPQVPAPAGAAAGAGAPTG